MCVRTGRVDGRMERGVITESKSRFTRSKCRALEYVRYRVRVPSAGIAHTVVPSYERISIASPQLSIDELLALFECDIHVSID